MKETIKEIREAHERIGKLLGQMEAAKVPAGAEVDPLEGKAVEGFYKGGVNTALIKGVQQLFFHPDYNPFCISPYKQRPTTPHHLTRVTERKVGRFYLIEGQDGSQPFHFGLFLGGEYVRWANSEVAPVNIVRNIDRLSMYEVTPTEK